MRTVLKMAVRADLVAGALGWAPLPALAGGLDDISIVDPAVLEPKLIAVSLLLLGVALLAVLMQRRWRAEKGLRAQAEAAVAEEKNRLNAILNNSAVGVLLTDRHARFLDVNRQWCQMFGYRRREARGGLRLGDVVHPDERLAYEAHCLELFSPDEFDNDVDNTVREQRFMRKDGSIFWGLISTSMVKNEAGRRLCVVSMITDIDAKKRVENSLRESEARLRFITENTLDVVWQIDKEFRFTYVNGADQRMRGYTRGEVLGEDFRALLTARGLTVFEQAMLPVLAGCEAENASVTFEVELPCKDGSSIWAEINCSPILGSVGEVVGFIGVTRDATERREKHEKLREASIRDPLTGLYNRRYLDERLPKEVHKAIENESSLVVLMIDIDRFKQLNDTHGHLLGDEVIRQLGEVIRTGGRSDDLPCRYGGEEFLVVMPHVVPEKVLPRIEHWRESFSQLAFQSGEESVFMTFSAGIAVLPDHGTTARELVSAADTALYAAKAQGRNRTLIYRPK